MTIDEVVRGLIDEVEAKYPTISGWDLFQLRPGGGAFKVIRGSSQINPSGYQAPIHTVVCDLAVSIAVDPSDPVAAQIRAVTLAHELQSLIYRYLLLKTDQLGPSTEYNFLCGVTQKRGSEKEWFAYAELFFDLKSLDPNPQPFF